MKEKIKRSYYDNGKLNYEISYTNGVCHGSSKWWYYNGKIQQENPYINGNVHGMINSWNDDGQLNFKSPHKNNIRCGARIVFKYEKYY